MQTSTSDGLLFWFGFLSFWHFHSLLLCSVRSQRIFRDGDVRWLTVPPASQAGCSHDSTGNSNTWKLPKVDLLLTPCRVAVLSKARRSTDSPKSKRLVQRFFYNFISAILVAFPSVGPHHGFFVSAQAQYGRNDDRRNRHQTLDEIHRALSTKLDSYLKLYPRLIVRTLDPLRTQ